MSAIDRDQLIQQKIAPSKHLERGGGVRVEKGGGRGRVGESMGGLGGIGRHQRKEVGGGIWRKWLIDFA